MILAKRNSKEYLSARKLATTGAAAHLLGGVTLHHFVGMDIYFNTRAWNNRI